MFKKQKNKILASFSRQRVISTDIRLSERARELMIELAMKYVLYNKLEGHYLELGVWRGDTFQYAYHEAQRMNLPKMQFYAFDSFRGFSEPMGKDNIGLIRKGNRAFSKDDFLKYISSHDVDLNKVKVVEGWFHETLNQETKRRLEIEKAAIVYIDCDLYEPAFQALNFIADLLEDGALLVFDDWFFLKGHPDRGERKAFHDWVNINPNLRYTDYFDFGWHGKVFVIHHEIDNSEGE